MPVASLPRMASGTRAVRDCSDTFIESLPWLGGDGSDRAASAERRAEQICVANEGVLHELGVRAAPGRRNGKAGLNISSSTRVGAIPLLSPVTGRPDFGLVVEPRFSWRSAGDMLAGTGFRILPEFLPLPDLPQSEQRVPPWVLSSVVLARMRSLLHSLKREFVMVDADLRTVRGHVDWDAYARLRFAVGRAADVPCRFPDLRDDSRLRSAIHWVVLRHREALLGQVSAGLVVRRLLELCEVLLVQLRNSPPSLPDRRTRNGWASIAINARVFREGIQALGWTVEERGLAGLSDLSGLAWRMDMEVFFEAWVEAIAEHASRRLGARFRCGRRNETRVPLDWEPTSSGSQRALIPDVVIERDDLVIVIDAKYKRHAEDIERLGWGRASDVLREQHRDDVLQALAYSTLFNSPRVVACLVYPATLERWRELPDHRRRAMRAKVRSGDRQVELALLPVPLSGDCEQLSLMLEPLFKGFSTDA